MNLVEAITWMIFIVFCLSIMPFLFVNIFRNMKLLDAEKREMKNLKREIQRGERSKDGKIVSYCRNGEDSDVYAYKSAVGYSIHVANSRDKQNPHCEDMWNCPEKPILEIENPSLEIFNKWWEYNAEVVSKWQGKHLNFDYHDLAGKAYFLETLEEFKNKMLELKELGLMVPDRAFERIKKEEIGI